MSQRTGGKRRRKSLIEFLFKELSVDDELMDLLEIDVGFLFELLFGK